MKVLFHPQMYDASRAPVHICIHTCPNKDIHAVVLFHYFYSQTKSEIVQEKLSYLSLACQFFFA